MVYKYKPGKIDFWVPMAVVEDMHLQIGDLASVAVFAGTRYSPPFQFRIYEARKEEQGGKAGCRIKGIEECGQYEDRPQNTCDTANPDEAALIMKKQRAEKVLSIFEQKSKAE